MSSNFANFIDLLALKIIADSDTFNTNALLNLTKCDFNAVFIIKLIKSIETFVNFPKKSQF